MSGRIVSIYSLWNPVRWGSSLKGQKGIVKQALVNYHLIVPSRGVACLTDKSLIPPESRTDLSTTTRSQQWWKLPFLRSQHACTYISRVHRNNLPLSCSFSFRIDVHWPLCPYSLTPRLDHQTRDYHGVSFLKCDGLLTEDQIQFRDQVKDFAMKEIAPLADECDRMNRFPQQLWSKLGNFGLLGPTVAVDDGGLGLDYLHHVLAVEQISRYSGSIGLSYMAHSHLCVNQIARWANDKQKRRFLPKLLDGSFVGALAISEPGAGSDVVSMKTTAVEDGDGNYILNGNKMWITNGPTADLVVVYAKTDPPRESKGITAFVVEKELKGYSTAQKLEKLGMRGSETCELIFEDCVVPKENVLGLKNGGTKVLMSGLDSERLILSAGPLGLMQACYDVVIPYVNMRKQFDSYIGNFQLIQGHIADIYTQLLTHRCVIYSIAKAYVAGQSGRADCSAIYLTAAEQATQITLKAIQILGGNGYTNEYPTGRFLRDAKLFEIGGGTTEIRRILIGRELNEMHRHTQQ